MVKFLMIPKNTKFYDLFEKATENIVLAAEKLVELFEDCQDAELRAKQLKELEEAGDTITHQILKRLHGSFVTPIDREDISLLAHTLDDVLDFIEAAGRSIYLYHIEEPTERARQLCAIILRMARDINIVVPRLRHHDQFSQIMEECVVINSMENEADDVHHAALAELFNHCSDPCRIIKWREIYQHLETATDRGEDVANVLEGVVLKNA